MTNSDRATRSSAGDWDVYWRGTRENAAHREGGPQEAVLEDFWTELFAQRAGAASPRILDLASGNGAVAGYALRAAPECLPCCLDYSVNAMVQLKRRHPRAWCVAGDAASTPFPDEQFDLVSSQFGLEYAGYQCIAEAARLVAPGGTLAVILHLRDGAIYQECEHNLRAIRAIEDSRLLALARDAFDAGFALNAGTGSAEAFKGAEKRFTPAIRALEETMRTLGRDVAAGLAEQLYKDIAGMYREMAAYEHADVMAWIDGMAMELQAYGGRMESMLAAALDAAAIEHMESLVKDCGLSLSRRRQLTMGDDTVAAAWALVWQRN